MIKDLRPAGPEGPKTGNKECIQRVDPDQKFFICTILTIFKDFLTMSPLISMER